MVHVLTAVDKKFQILILDKKLLISCSIHSILRPLYLKHTVAFQETIDKEYKMAKQGVNIKWKLKGWHEITLLMYYLHPSTIFYLDTALLPNYLTTIISDSKRQWIRGTHKRFEVY